MNPLDRRMSHSSLISMKSFSSDDEEGEPRDHFDFPHGQGQRADAMSPLQSRREDLAFSIKLKEQIEKAKTILEASKGDIDAFILASTFGVNADVLELVKGSVKNQTFAAGEPQKRHEGVHDGPVNTLEKACLTADEPQSVKEDQGKQACKKGEDESLDYSEDCPYRDRAFSKLIRESAESAMADAQRIREAQGEQACKKDENGNLDYPQGWPFGADAIALWTFLLGPPLPRNHRWNGQVKLGLVLTAFAKMNILHADVPCPEDRFLPFWGHDICRERLPKIALTGKESVSLAPDMYTSHITGRCLTVVNWLYPTLNPRLAWWMIQKHCPSLSAVITELSKVVGIDAVQKNCLGTFKIAQYSPIAVVQHDDWNRVKSPHIAQSRKKLQQQLAKRQQAAFAKRANGGQRQSDGSRIGIVDEDILKLIVSNYE